MTLSEKWKNDPISVLHKTSVNFSSLDFLGLYDHQHQFYWFLTMKILSVVLTNILSKPLARARKIYGKPKVCETDVVIIQIHEKGRKNEISHVKTSIKLQEIKESEQNEIMALDAKHDLC